MRSAFACFSSAFTQFDLHCKNVSGSVENELSSFVARSSAEGAATCTVSTPIFQPPSEQPIQQVMCEESELKMPEATNDAEILPKFYMDKKEFSVDVAVVKKARETNQFKYLATVSKTSTNRTSEKHLVLLDSGFGGLLLSGEDSLTFYTILSRRVGKTIKFIFGAGESISTNKIVLLKGLGEAHVVPTQ